MSTTSGFSAIINMKCPRCRQGKLFCNPTSYNYRTLFQMPVQCEVCGQRLEPEPGFYYGGMYVNYGFSVLLLAVTFSVLYGVFRLSAYYVLGTYIGILLLIGPWMFRYSRVLFLNMFVHYDETYSTKKSE
jgi:uncharacterized protein (DUF983 family)